MAIYDPSQSAGFEIPMDKYRSSYSGYDPEYRTSMLEGMSGWEPGKGSDRITDYYAPSYGKIDETFNSASGRVPGYYDKAGASLPKMFQNQLAPALQTSLNDLARRNILKSSVAGEALGETGRRVSSDILGLQTGLAGQEAGAMSNLETGKAGILSQLAGAESGDKAAYDRLLPGFLSSMGHVSTSEDPFQPVQAYLNLIEQMIF